MQNDALAWLMSWYAQHCDGDWEHEYGVRVETIDNPGWHVSVDLAGTAFEDLYVAQTRVDRTEQDWFHVRTRDGRLEGYGGPGNLIESLQQFEALLGPGGARS